MLYEQIIVVINVEDHKIDVGTSAYTEAYKLPSTDMSTTLYALHMSRPRSPF
jgi:hypothetical protein